MDNRSVNHKRNGNCSHSMFNSGCGCNDTSGIVITISPTTGGQFNLEVRKTDSIDHLKKIISKKLKVFQERICLLYRERQLMNGSLEENELNDGSRLTLLPIVETGLTPQAPELSVMNALENLNESQINDFLSGKAPLNLTMRLGDHMMLIQLMLSTFSNQSQTAEVALKSDERSVNISRKNFSSSFSKHSYNEKKSSDVLCSSNSHLEKILSSPSETSTSASPTELKSDLTSQGNGSSTKITSIQQVPDSSWYFSSRNSKSNVHKCSSSRLVNSCTCSTNSCLPSLSCNSNAVPLAKATRNLTQTLQKLSSEVMTSKKVATTQKSNGTNTNIMHFRGKPSAILENMEHHGRGIYSGTFSGTLNPALQDSFGRPKKDVSTIIHILNDLLCAQPRPQCKATCNCMPNVVDKMDVSLNNDLHSTSLNTLNNTINHPSNIVSSCESNSSGSPLIKNFDLFNKQNENQTTRSKMELLKSKMEERKEKRKEKRLTPYKKKFSSLNLISASAINTAEVWPSTATDSSSIHGLKLKDSIDAESSPPIHSSAVIA